MHRCKWDGDNYRRSRNPPSTQTESMIAMMERWGLDLCLEQCTITRPPSNLRSKQGSTIDLVWAAAGVQGMIRNCGVDDELDCASDHFPIVTTLEYLTTEPPKVVQRHRKLLWRNRRPRLMRYRSIRSVRSQKSPSKELEKPPPQKKAPRHSDS
jgi:hypothetical protein